MTTQISGREFNQDTSGAKKAAEKGPVYITDRGRPAHVLLTFDAYEGMLRAWLDRSVTAAFAERVLPVDERVARRAASLHVSDPAPFRDALIGGTALTHGMTVVTRDLKDFERFDGLEVINPWR